MNDVSWAAIWAAAGAMVTAALSWLTNRRRAENDERSGDWSRLRAEIDRLDGRCDHLQQEVDKCHAEKAEWMQRAIAAEAVHLGLGKAHQDAAEIVAVERLRDRNKEEEE